MRNFLKYTLGLPILIINSLVMGGFAFLCFVLGEDDAAEEFKVWAKQAWEPYR